MGSWAGRLSRRARFVVVLALTAPAALPAAAQADYPQECVGPDNTGKIVCTFSAPGAHPLVLPDGVMSIDADVYGASGGGTSFGPGGLGGHATATLAVFTSSIQVTVGGQGASPVSGGGVNQPTPTGGANGGGAGHPNFSGAGGGGSDIRVGGTALADRVLVAGGGGGGGNCQSGPSNFATGGSGGGETGGGGGAPSCSGVGGGGGTQTAGGGANTPAAVGTFGAGGPSSSGSCSVFGQPAQTRGGGGGGGGWYGGGGGWCTGGGGGGSGHGPDGTVFQSGVRSGSGLVVVSFTQPVIPVAPSGLATDPPVTANDNLPRVKGSAPAGSTVEVYATGDCTGTPAAIGSADDFGSPGLTVSVADDTTTSFTARSFVGGSRSVCSGSVQYEEDSSLPSQPSGLTTDPASPADNNSPSVKGSAEAGSTVNLYTTSDCSGTPVATGSAADFASPGLAVSVGDDSTTLFRATSTDAAANTSPCSSAVKYVEDSTDPAAPSGLATDPASPANDNTPQVQGSAEADSTVRVYTTSDCTDTPVATGSAAAFASPGLAVSVADDSTTSFRAQATDQAGNVSPCSSAVTYVEDSTAPPAPSGLATDPASPANNNTPKVKGSAAVGSTVRVYTSSDCTDTPVAAGSAADFASPGLTVSPSVADDSSTTFRATATDQAGNTSPCSAGVTYVEDSTAAAPSGLVIDPASPANDNSPKVKGSAEAGSTVEVFTSSDCTGTPVASGPAADFGSPGLAVSVADDSTTTFRAKTTDTAGNVSPCSSGVTYVEDSTDPGAPSGLAADPSGPANDNSLRITGSAEAGSLVHLYTTSDCSGPPAASGSAADFGSPGLAVSVADDSTTTFRARATDSAGNESSCSNGVTYVEDSTAPDAPSGLATAPSGQANDNNPRVKGSAEAGSAVAVYTTGDCSGTPAVTGSAAEFGSPGLAVPVADDSTTTFRVKATDAVGNVSPCSSAVTYVEDSSAPPAPSGLATDPAGPANDNNPRVAGSAEAGSTVAVYRTSDCSGTPAASGSAADFASPGLAVPVPDDSDTAFRAQATDAAGNVSACSSETTYRERSPLPPSQQQPQPQPEEPTRLLPGACANPMLGTNGADRLLATPAGDRVDGLRGDDGLYGFDGDDCVAGREGRDRIYGGRGDDVLRGDDGNDLVYGQEGDDTLSGGAGNDGLKGGDGTNRYYGRSGRDRIYARNGVAETVDCGSGRDVAVIDADDRVRGCERISR